ncbi:MULTISPECIES: aldehyde dehydrogenase family protein [unclassified Mesorhizobium]|uniref:aldehyde dehydrogenase family protein n=1 Tax=unclassified Mesorhizobium TaxID=325217 RepID=UPI000BB0BE81|nr:MULTISPECIES: aldehyde dehydrogenase family protein [unclassified Mesorhizobium]TGT63369.1 aldehyde dehydrogenase [Mesorhizobium sp. M00.F.Ca.ET.170.01.1.1]AZO11540.1 aldehyde dehydrogenase [Mesorhizobium sp. M3A.F.Ca.ET.080.04.2.1]PBB88197.1 aldehyde dehydrogenase [Mesorhizobium sp. WSM3876]RWB67282.1 MAG: aldehyde dehydrogenase [Mesorhizobium sp.]RWB91958.1 MAG: aldehyde dehydrogenase [Mesorhizobium sp.]
MSLSFDPDTISLPLGHFIGGELLSVAGAIEMRRPSDGKAYAACPVAGVDVVDRAVESAKSALKASNWGGVRPRERTRALQAWADLIELEAESLAKIEALCSTRPVGQIVAGDIAVTAEQIRFFAEFADKEGSELVPTDDASLGMIVSEPYGVVGAITPWNFPISMAGWKLGPALAAGNAVVLKPSEMTPFSAVYMAQLAVRAGLPAGLVNVVLGDGPTTGTALTGHSDIAKVSFTGSTRAGSAIMENVARTGVKPMTLELGGKSPQLVFADADLDKAATAIAGSVTFNAGQACVAGTRLIVENSVAERLTVAIVERMKAMRPAPTWNEATQYSPIISDRQRTRVDALVRAAIEAGGECLTGGGAMESPGYFYEPTLIANADQANPAIVEEIFGPVLTVQTFETEEEALALSSHPTYGLASGLFTADLSRTIRLARKLEAGTVWINRYSRSRDHILPTGGYKRSGIGKDLGREAYLANRRTKSVLISL